MGSYRDQHNIARVGNGIPGNSGVVWNGMDRVEWDGRVGKTSETSEMDLVKIWYMTSLETLSLEPCVVIILVVAAVVLGLVCGLDVLKWWWPYV